MSRRITIASQMNDKTLLTQTLEKMNVEFQEVEEVLRIRQNPEGEHLLFGGIALEESEDGIRVEYDEDCERSLGLIQAVQQQYTRAHYLKHAMRQGDQVQQEYVATGDESHPLIEEGDIVLVARKY